MFAQNENTTFILERFQKFDAIGRRKVKPLLRLLGYQKVYDAEDVHAHYDVIAEDYDPSKNSLLYDIYKDTVDWYVPHRIEVGVRENHFLQAIEGRLPDVRIPKRKCFIDCDGTNETPNLPHFVIETDDNEVSHNLFYIANHDIIAEGIPNIYETKTSASRGTGEKWIPLRKDGVYRISVHEGVTYNEGLVSDGRWPDGFMKRNSWANPMYR